MVNNNPKITVVLNAFKRTEHLESQLDAIESQTVKPDHIYVWQNHGGIISPEIKKRVTLVECSDNLGVWARFAFALNCDSEYICLFDDDTIPGKKWFENCLNTMKTHSGLLGTRGLKYLSRSSYEPYIDVGWKKPNNEIEQVDIVGHCWFFKREHLSLFWQELPELNYSKTSGEDIHFSYMLQKNGIGTFVPPHPSDDLELWGSQPESGKKLGGSSVGISINADSNTKFDIAYRHYIAKGFSLVLSNKERLKEGIVIGPGLTKNQFIRNVVNKSPKLTKIAKIFVGWLKKNKIHI